MTEAHRSWLVVGVYHIGNVSLVRYNIGLERFSPIEQWLANVRLACKAQYPSDILCSLKRHCAEISQRDRSACKKNSHHVGHISSAKAVLSLYSHANLNRGSPTTEECKFAFKCRLLFGKDLKYF